LAEVTDIIAVDIKN